jgi:DNA end-binding protein Ku
MAPRAQWKGFLKVGELSCNVALYTAASEAERISLHTINRNTGHRVRRIFVDVETEKPVEREDQVKGYEIDKDQYVVFEPEEIQAVMPVSDKTIKVEAFIECSDIDSVYFDKPYYLAPANKAAAEAFFLIREGLKEASVAAIAEAVLFRRVRTLLIRAHGPGLIATTLNYEYEVRSAEEAFEDVPNLKIKSEMVDLAEHIIDTKRGKFDPKEFDDRYESALADLVRAKAEGKAMPKRKPPVATNVVDLMEALRESAGKAPAKKRAAAKPKAKTKTKAKPKAKTKAKTKTRTGRRAA